MFGWEVKISFSGRNDVHRIIEKLQIVYLGCKDLG